MKAIPYINYRLVAEHLWDDLFERATRMYGRQTELPIGNCLSLHIKKGDEPHEYTYQVLAFNEVIWEICDMKDAVRYVGDILKDPEHTIYKWAKEDIENEQD